MYQYISKPFSVTWNEKALVNVKPVFCEHHIADERKCEPCVLRVMKQKLRNSDNESEKSEG